ncbi:hypothetical protein [Streptomyces sp. NPDC059452]|uniref:hypothetical protein n=1 Tax=Streptomyces sp. NPDC059452 TaxID=3346835 RepID=UPI0036B711C9
MARTAIVGAVDVGVATIPGGPEAPAALLVLVGPAEADRWPQRRQRWRPGGPSGGGPAEADRR